MIHSMTLLKVENKTSPDPYLSESLYGPCLRTSFILNAYEHRCVCGCVYAEVPMEARTSWSYRWL